jgi:hypothetical protein
MATITPAVVLIGRKTSRLAGITRAVATKSQGAGHSLSRYWVVMLLFDQTF